MTAFKIGAFNEDKKCKRKFSDKFGHNILRLFDRLPNFVNTSEKLFKN